MKFEQNVKLSNYTTFGIGGDAKFFCVVKSVEEALEALDYAKRNSLAIFLLGGGSNVLVSDDGFNGLVIKNEIKAFKVKENFITAGGGEIWDEVVQKCLDLQLQGIECLSAIPGTFGGAVVQNIGAYGQTLSDVVDSVEAIEISTGKVKIFSKSECQFEYRSSFFKSNPGHYLVVAAILKLNQIDRANIAFYSLQKYFYGKINPTLAQVREAVITLRDERGMVILPNLESYKSAGSFFKNPVITEDEFDKLTTKIKCSDPWFWNQTNGVKVSAACLLTSAGFEKGQTFDGARISPKQPLALINPGFAKAADIKNLAEKIKKTVQSKFGVELEEEIVYI